MPVIKKLITPRTLPELIAALAETDGTILAGGTDLQPRWLKGVVDRPQIVLDAKKIEELHGIQRDGDAITVGACTLMSELETDPLIRASAAPLAEAASRVACGQIRNRATVGGNLCNASPAADTAVPLLLFDAEVELASLNGGGVSRRSVPLSEFFTGPGKTTLARGEVLTRVRFASVPEGAFCAWEKFGTRPAMEIAVASVGVLLAFAGDTVEHARVAYGSVAPIPLRGTKAEAALTGHTLDAGVITQAVDAAQKEVSPITDVRASEDYRREIVGVLLQRMLEDAKRS